MSTRTVSLLLSLVIGMNFLASCTLIEDVRGEGARLSSSGRSEEDVQHADATTHAAEDAELLLMRGIASANQGQYDEAAADFDAAIAISPDGPRAYLYRGVVSGIRGNYEKAAEDHLTALKVDLLSPEDAATQHEQWRSSVTMWAIYLRSGDYAKAIEDYDTFTSLSPYEADAYMWRGCAYYLKGEVDRAIVDYDEAITLTPDNALALYKRGLAHARLGNSLQAVRDFERAMAIGFDEASGESGEAGQERRITSRNLSEHGRGIFHHTRALERLSRADYDNAVADIDKARKLIAPERIHLYTDEMHRVYYQSGVAYYDTGLYNEAVLLFDKALEVVPAPSDYPAAIYQRGMSHYRAGRHRLAIADLQSVLHLEQDFPDAAHYRRMAQEELAK